MAAITTPHNEANAGDIAQTVLMPGDPLRAQWIAEEYLEDPVCFNRIRGMLGYTGTYQGVRVSVMGSGMGMPSIGIYSYELYHVYGVRSIIRIGTIGGMEASLRLGDVIIGMGACTDSAYEEQYHLPGRFAPVASWRLLKQAVEEADSRGCRYQVGNILSSDIFYCDDDQDLERWKKMNVLGVEMEAAALYMNAARAGKDALAVCTVSNRIGEDAFLTPEDQKNAYRSMVEIALGVAVKESGEG